MRHRLAAAVSLVILGSVSAAVAQPRLDKPRKRPPAQAGRLEAIVPGFFPGQQPEVPLAQRIAAAREESLRYKGIDIKLQPGIDGPTQRMQSAAARLLERLDYVPSHRIDTYRWLTDTGQYSISAWHAEVLDSKKVAAGSVLKVQVWAEFGDSGLGTAVHTIETYLYTPDGTIEHLDSVAPKASKITVVN